jgi:prepilin-type N-terminal cleavage/methylation domain-containing protein
MGLFSWSGRLKTAGRISNSLMKARLIWDDRPRAGFTLTELVVVTAIMGVMAALGVPGNLRVHNGIRPLARWRFFGGEVIQQIVTFQTQVAGALRLRHLRTFGHESPG